MFIPSLLAVIGSAFVGVNNVSSLPITSQYYFQGEIVLISCQSASAISDFSNDDTFALDLTIDNVVYERFINVAFNFDSGDNCTLSIWSNMNINYVVYASMYNDSTELYQYSPKVNCSINDGFNFYFTYDEVYTDSSLNFELVFCFLDEATYQTLNNVELDYNRGYQTGYDEGYSYGETTGYQNGYHQGVEDTMTTSDVTEIFTNILEIGLLPVNVFLAMLNFEILGINVGGFVSALLTIAMIVIVLKLILGGKADD